MCESSHYSLTVGPDTLVDRRMKRAHIGISRIKPENILR
jgi:hypothetical protein